MDRPQDARAWAQWLLLSLDHDGDDELTASRPRSDPRCSRIHQRAAEAGRNIDLEIIAGRYQLVDRLMAEVCRAPASAPPQLDRSRRRGADPPHRRRAWRSRP